MSEQIHLNDIRIDGGTQPRAELHWLVVADYAEDMKRGSQFPPIVVFYDGTDYWLADGFHRFHAAKEARLAAVLADVRQGTRRDAVLFSVGANASHGLRRRNQDKRRAVETLLRDAEWAAWSDREIARRAAVSNNFVGELRRSLSLDDSQPIRHGADGRTTNTANIGSAPKPPSRPLPRDLRDALTDATFHAPDRASDLLSKTIDEGLAADAVDHAREVLSDPETPPALADYILAPETMVQDAQGHITFSEVSRVQERELERTPEMQGMPVARYLVALGGYRGVRDEHVAAWIESTTPDEWEVARITLDGVRDFIEQLERHINGRTKTRLRVVEG